MNGIDNFEWGRSHRSNVTSSYADKVSRYNRFNVDDAIAISYDSLSPEERSRPWNAVNHGVELLSTELQLNSYMVAYGEMHRSKCLASLQNFPFDSIQVLDIVDWGCGQGIATMCLLDALAQHDKLSYVKTITLIEPSSAALNRAQINIRQMLKGCSVTIRTINQYLPEKGELSDVSFSSTRTTVHLFSNILDIVSVDLVKTAKLMMNSGGDHIVLAVGPMNDNSGRLDEFFRLFKDAALFSNIARRDFGMTSLTGYPFTCKTKGFRYNLDKTVFNYQANICAYSESGAYDDYDIRAHVRNGQWSESFADLYEKVLKEQCEKDHVFIKPDISGDKPDLLIVRRGRGIGVIVLFEEPLSGYQFSDEPVINKDGNPSLDKEGNPRAFGVFRKKGTTGEDGKLMNPIHAASRYAENILVEHSRVLLSRFESNSGLRYFVTPIVVFAKDDTRTVQQFWEGGKLSFPSNRTVLVGKDQLLTTSTNLFDVFGLNKYTNLLDDAACDDVLASVHTKWHSCSQGRSINLNSAQKALSRSIAGAYAKIRGFAGSGKTHVLANRAVQAQLRTGGRVLVLTYNVTLSNYVRQRIGMVQADFPWSSFTITNYHRFVSMICNSVEKKLSLADFNDTECLNGYENRIKRYDAIFVDEVQDFDSRWIELLMKVFLVPNGEMVLFGDARQNIYKHALADGDDIDLPSRFGSWNTRLKEGFRFSNNNIANLAINFQRMFMEGDPHEIVLQGSLFGDTCCIQKQRETSPEDIAATIVNIINAKLDGDAKNTVVLSSGDDLLRAIDYGYRKITGRDTITVFESAELFEQLENSANGDHNNVDIYEIRDSRKRNFTMDHEDLKFCTIYSFKGWEAENVVLVIPPYKQGTSDETPYARTKKFVSPELIYTAITRARSNLYIINMGNTLYGSFLNTMDKLV